MTKAKLTEELNKISQEKTHYFTKLIEADNKVKALEEQLKWHKQMNQELVATIKAGASEAVWPRRPDV